jgi:tetrahydromethanopterin S-methyltransferase subunit G
VADQTDNGNGRVTMALLGQKVDGIACDVQSILERLERMDERQRVTNNVVIQHGVQIETQGREIDTLRTRDTVVGLISSIVAGMIAFLGWLAGARQ